MCIRFVLIALCVGIAGPASASDAVVFLPTRDASLAEVIRAELEPLLEERTAEFRQRPARLANKGMKRMAKLRKAVVALGANILVDVSLHRGRLSVIVVAEDGRTLHVDEARLPKKKKDLRRDRTSTLAQDTGHILSRALLTDYPTPKWQPQAPRPVRVPLELVTTEELEAPGRLPAWKLKGFGRSYASLSTPNRW